MMKTGKFDAVRFRAHLSLLECGLAVDVLSVRLSVCQIKSNVDLYSALSKISNALK